MVKYTISMAREYAKFITPEKTELWVHVEYLLPSGYVGIIELPKAQATPEKIQEIVKREATPITELVGKTIETAGK